MKCPSCQSNNPQSAKFCVECGNKFETICPKCGINNSSAFKFCYECGVDLKSVKETISIDYSEPHSYTPKFLADKILTTRSSIEGERKLVTVLFADVANYTSMAEKLDPEEVHHIMDGCFKILMDEIHKFEGTINQFTGDGVMALFGAPVAHEDHAQRACHAALLLQKALVDFEENVSKDFGADFKMRIGINSGPVVVGSIGDDLRMDYTAVGDTSNIASRMENMAKPGTSLVSRHTHKLVRDFFEFKSLGKVEVKGKEVSQEAFELIKAGEVETRIGAAVAKGLTRFVGRKNSVTALVEAYDKAKSGSGQLLGIVGEAGVGKSRLILELRSLLSEENCIFLEGRCMQYGGSVAYLPILNILRSYFKIEKGDRDPLIKKKMNEKILKLDDKLHSVLHPFYELLSLEIEDADYQKLEPIQKREKAFEATRDLLVRESQDRPIILVVEDLHWIDKTSEEFIGYLIEWIANTRILMILLYRSEYTHAWGSKSYYTKIGLTHLSSQSSSELIRAILYGCEIESELETFIINSSAGTPLFIEELTHSLLENGAIQTEQNQCFLAVEPKAIQIPDTIQGIIAARMDRLEDNLKRTMQVASVIGRDFAFRILQTITGMREELKSDLLHLQGSEFIYEKSLFPELEYIFKHALMQEVAYNSMLNKRKKEVHGKIGKAIEKLYAERLEEFYEMLAYHYSKSDNLEVAYKYLRLSAEKARGNYSLWECSHFLKDSINILNQLSGSKENKKEKMEILISLSIIMRMLGFPKGSIEILLDGERLSKELGDDRSLAGIYSSEGIYHYFGGKPSKAKRYIEDCFQLYPKIRDVDTMAPIALDISIFCTWGGEFTKTCEVARAAIDILEATHREFELFDRPYNMYSYLCAYYGLSKGMLGDFDEGKIFCEKGLSFASDANRVYDFVSTELMLGLLLVFKGEAKESIKHFQTCIESGKKGEFFLVLGAAWSGLGLGHYLLKDLGNARRHLDEGLKIHKDFGINAWISLNYLTRCMVNFELGALKDAITNAEKALRLAQQNEEKWLEGKSYMWAGRISGKTDPSQSDQAEASILRGIQILNDLRVKPLSSKGYLFLGELHANTGQKEKALENLKKAEEMFREMGMDYWLTRAREVSSIL